MKPVLWKLTFGRAEIPVEVDVEDRERDVRGGGVWD